MSTNEKLPDSFDVVIFGTGLTESMVAASLARIDKKVLHVDRNDYYGGHWATFNFNSFIEFLKTNSPAEKAEFNSVSAMQIPISKFDGTIENIVIKTDLPDKNEQLVDAEVPETEQEGLLENSEETNHELEVDGLLQTNEEMLKEKCCITAPDTNLKDTTEITNNDVVTNDEHLKSEQDIENKSETILETNIENQNKKAANLVVKSTSPSIVSQAKIQQGGKNVTLEDFSILSRKFNLDISPKFLFSAGPLVQAIIKANITHYAEFKLVNRILMCKDNEIVEVPCNRGDVFNSSFLSMIEKRVLMKFLTLCVELDLESDDIKSFIGKPFDEFLKTKRLSDNLRKFVIYSIAMVKPDTATELALVETQNFLKSLGRFGKSPFIWPLFGIAELPQAFCRMCAVFGGLYCLRIDIKSISLNETFDTCQKVMIDDQEITCDHIVMDNSYVPDKFRSSDESSSISKAILITNRSLSPCNEEQISFLTIPPLPGKSELVRVIEVGPASSACPSGLFVLYLTCISTNTAFEDLQEYAEILTCSNIDETDEKKPNLMWSAYFNQVANISYSNYPKNMFITSMPGSSLGFASAVVEAEAIFHSICPDKEFMLAVPNPEDIIWDHDGMTTEKGKEDGEMNQDIDDHDEELVTQKEIENVEEDTNDKDIIQNKEQLEKPLDKNEIKSIDNENNIS